MRQNDFNVGQRFRYHGQTYTVTKKSGLPCAPKIRTRVVTWETPTDGGPMPSGGWFFLNELREWARDGLVEFVK